jgi:hypothetical protein
MFATTLFSEVNRNFGDPAVTARCPDVVFSWPDKGRLIFCATPEPIESGNKFKDEPIESGNKFKDEPIESGNKFKDVKDEDLILSENDLQRYASTPLSQSTRILTFRRHK